jgi:predicted phage tail protein
VDFYQGPTLIGSSTTAPYTMTWSSVAAGSYSLTARALDNTGATTTSTAVTVQVNPPANVAPTVSLTSPANNATYTAPATIAVSASAADSDGTVARVDFYQGATMIGSSTTAPYAMTWSSVAAGTYSLTARAIDNTGATTTSAAVSVQVNPPANVAPTVSLTSPANNATYTALATITVSATAADSDGTVARVDFYQGATLIGSSTTAPYAMTWSSVAAGTYSLTARAVDSTGATTTSTAVTVQVKAAANVAPTVSLTSPLNNAVYTAPATFTLKATAADSDGTIVRVDFYAGTTLIGSRTSAPYSITFNNVPAGVYTFTARATDNAGATTTSAARTILVRRR